jgi:hypothetical protein
MIQRRVNARPYFTPHSKFGFDFCNYLLSHFVFWGLGSLIPVDFLTLPHSGISGCTGAVGTITTLGLHDVNAVNNMINPATAKHQKAN